MGELAERLRRKRYRVHGYRAHFSAHTAVRSVRGLPDTGHTKIIEGDLAAYFDSLPHAELLKSVARGVSDRHLLHLIKMWLAAPRFSYDYLYDTLGLVELTTLRA
ncbi:MAG: hypothetical protein ACYDBZ_18265 [Steroidobacteraceae bacterium]